MISIARGIVIIETNILLNLQVGTDEFCCNSRCSTITCFQKLSSSKKGAAFIERNPLISSNFLIFLTSALIRLPHSVRSAAGESKVPEYNKLANITPYKL